MTIIPQPLQKPLRGLEIVFGLICVVAGAWALVRFGTWLIGNEPIAEKLSWWNALLLLVQALYLLSFGGNLLRRGYLSLVLWVIALAILCVLPTMSGLAG